MKKTVARAALVVVLSFGFASVLKAQLSDASQEAASSFVSPSSVTGDARERDTVKHEAGGLELTRWATDSLLGSPVSIALDDQGRAYVTQTTRRKSSNLDIRQHRDWMAQDLSFQSVEDRRAFLHEMLDASRSDENPWLEDRNEDGVRDWRDLTVEQERVYRLADTDGDGVADTSIVFAEGFNTEEVTGVAAGVLPYEEDVFVTVAPDVWRLRDTTGDGRADQFTSISNGYGVHMSYAGHDMSGLTRGPDGRIYWAIGDVGLRVEGPEGRTWAYPNQGAVMRAEPDGSHFEVFAHGLRNTHELAFDEHGNLFSVDNDGDRSGEHERVVYIVEDSDSGWRTNWQFGKYGRAYSAYSNEIGNYNVWMEEALYKPHFEEQAAYITPPVAPYYDGPSGFAYNPGTALNERWQGHFFISLFTGSASQARIRAFQVEEKGASFELADDQEVLGGTLTTSLAFGPGGALYLADWVNGWEATDQGRVWKLDDPETATSPLRTGTRKLLAEGMSGRSVDELSELMQHADMRVRMRAQFELVGRGETGAEALLAAASGADHPLARLHGVWGIGQLGRETPEAVAPLVRLLDDADAEVRAQAAKVIGEAMYRPATEDLTPLLQDSEARVQFFAAIALGKLGHEKALKPVVEMLDASGGDDPYLRHAGATAMAKIGDPGALVDLADHASPWVRLAAVVGLRRLGDPGVARFLQDEREQVATEAARAIHDDSSIEPALPALAEVLSREGLTREPLLRRAINANLRVGRAPDAQRLAAYAARASAPPTMRAEALASLGVWPEPPVLDRVEGRYRALGTRAAAAAHDAIEPVVGTLLADRQPEVVRIAAAEAVARLAYREASPSLHEIVADERQPTAVRRAALGALGALRDEQLAEAAAVALRSEDPEFRQQAQQLIPAIDSTGGGSVPLLTTILQNGALLEQQGALTSLGDIDTDASNEVLSTWMDKLRAGEVALGLQLDLISAAEQSTSEEVAAKLRQYNASQSEDDVLATYRVALKGGRAEVGRSIVYEHPTAQCIRCHQIGGEGGQVGPDLTGIGARKSRRYLLESLVAPSATITPGYGNIVLTLKEGTTVAGTLDEETETHVLVKTGDGTTTEVAKTQIAERTQAPSSMPSMVNLLSTSEIRDVVAYLASLKQEEVNQEGASGD